MVLTNGGSGVDKGRGGGGGGGNGGRAAAVLTNLNPF